jgi:hypothetical protein
MIPLGYLIETGEGFIVYTALGFLVERRRVRVLCYAFGQFDECSPVICEVRADSSAEIRG